MTLYQQEKNTQNKNRNVCLSIRDVSQNKKIIFGHDIGSLTSADKTTPHYAERALIMAEKNDNVILNRPTDTTYINYLKSIGIGTVNVLILNSETIYQGIKQASFKKEEASYSPYIAKKADQRIQKKVATHFIGNPETITMKYYNKASFKHVCSSLQIETAPGEIFRPSYLQDNQEKLTTMVQKFLAPTGEVILRHATGDGGFNIMIANRENANEVIAKVLKDRSVYVVESKLPLQSSPCVLGLIDQDGPTLVAVSKQILKDGKQYAGSILDYEAAVDKTIYATFMKIANKMHQDGYRGPFGIDFIITEDGKKMPCECNARVNGSFYPHEVRQSLARKNIEFPVVYAMEVDSPKFKNFTELYENPKVQHVLYQGKSESGILPFNVTSMEYGHASFIVLSKSHDEAKKLAREFKNVLRDA